MFLYISESLDIYIYILNLNEASSWCSFKDFTCLAQLKISIGVIGLSIDCHYKCIFLSFFPNRWPQRHSVTLLVPDGS